jgi:hypothetical protein
MFAYELIKRRKPVGVTFQLDNPQLDPADAPSERRAQKKHNRHPDSCLGAMRIGRLREQGQQLVLAQKSVIEEALRSLRSRAGLDLNAVRRLRAQARGGI